MLPNGQTVLPNGQTVLPNDVRVQRSLCSRTIHSYTTVWHKYDTLGLNVIDNLFNHVIRYVYCTTRKAHYYSILVCILNYCIQNTGLVMCLLRGICASVGLFNYQQFSTVQYMYEYINCRYTHTSKLFLADSIVLVHSYTFV